MSIKNHHTSKRRKIAHAAIFSIVFFISICAWAILAQANESDQKKQVETRIPEINRILRDVEYVPDGHERQKLDLYIPPPREDSAALPLIVWIHGGAWMAGSKDNCPATPFLKEGYVVASANYRLAQHATFPAQIEDCKAAIRYLRANADKYNIDPNRIGVWGASAGGHLVALLGTTGDVNDFNKGPNWYVSSKVQAVCDYFGPTDLIAMIRMRGETADYEPNSPVFKLIGGPIKGNEEAYKKADPITFISEGDPPFIIFHGDKDNVVPINQSELLEAALKKAGIEVTFHTVEGAGHGFRDPKIKDMVLEFFDKQLKKAGKEPPK